MNGILGDYGILSRIVKGSDVLPDQIVKTHKIVKRRIREEIVSGRMPGSIEQRCMLWVIMMLDGNHQIDAKQYLDLVSKGKCSEENYEQIRRDSYRSVSDVEDEKSLIRILCAYVHKNPSQRYTQHMSSIVSILNLVCPEPIALSIFDKLTTVLMPTYWSKNSLGTKAGILLAEMCVFHTDRLLHAMFWQDSYSFETCVNSWFMRFLAHLQPLDEIVKLWDYIFTSGPHHIVYVVVAIVLSMKNVIRERKRVVEISLRQRAALEGVKDRAPEDTVQEELERFLEDDSLVKTPLELFSEQTIMRTEMDASVILPLAYSLSQSTQIPADVHESIAMHTMDESAALYCTMNYTTLLSQERQ